MASRYYARDRYIYFSCRKNYAYFNNRELIEKHGQAHLADWWAPGDADASSKRRLLKQLQELKKTTGADSIAGVAAKFKLSRAAAVQENEPLHPPGSGMRRIRYIDCDDGDRPGLPSMPHTSVSGTQRGIGVSNAAQR